MTKGSRVTKAKLKQIDRVIDRYREQKWALIPLLHKIQGVHGYIPAEVIPRIARGLGLFPSQVQGVVTFYEQFYTAPRGKNIVRVCRGTACHVKGSHKVLETVMNLLKLKPGQTSRDKLFSLEVVACMGACGLAPVVNVNGEFYAKADPQKVARIIQQCRSQESCNAQS